MKKMAMILVAAAVMMSPLASYARPVHVFIGPHFGWGPGFGWYSPYWGPYPYGYYG